MKKKMFFLIVVLLKLFILSGCTKKIALEEVDENTENSVDSSLTASNVTAHPLLFKPHAAADNIKSEFKAAFRKCGANGPTFKRIIYLGPSNDKYLGCILSSDNSLLRRDLQKELPASAFNSIVKTGIKVDNCDLSEVRNIDFSFFIDDNRLSPLDTLAKMMLTHYDSISISEGNWQVDELIVDDYLDSIASPDYPKIAGYRKSLLEKGNVVITKVVKISGFKGSIYSQNNFGIKITAQIPTQLQLIDSLNVGLKLNVESSQKINVTSSGNFYIIGSIMKGKLL